MYTDEYPYLLSVIIPVYNEERTILKVIHEVQKVPLEKQIIIVNDASTDNTKDYLSSISSSNIHILNHRTNLGKGCAIQTAIPYLKGRFTVIQDADLEYCPGEYLDLIQPFQNSQVAAVYGSRFLKLTSKKHLYRHHYWGNKMLNVLTNALYGSQLSDIESCYKMIRTDILRKLQLTSTGFEIEPEITIKLLSRGVHIHEIPITYHPRTFEEGKKMRWWNGFAALKTILKYRLVRSLGWQ